MQKEALPVRIVVGSLRCMMKDWAVNKEIKKTFHNNIIVSRLTYVREAWNEGQRS